MLAVTRRRELCTGIALTKVAASSQMRRVVQQQLIVGEQLIFEFLRPDHGDRTCRTNSTAWAGHRRGVRLEVSRKLRSTLVHGDR